MQPIENERLLIAQIADRNTRGRTARKAGEPEVGIFFLYSGEVPKDSKQLCVTEAFGKFNCADSEYDRYWKFGQRYGVVPREIECDEVARGRVEYDINEEEIHVHADSGIRITPDKLSSMRTKWLAFAFGKLMPCRLPSSDFGSR